MSLTGSTPVGKAFLFLRTWIERNPLSFALLLSLVLHGLLLELPLAIRAVSAPGKLGAQLPPVEVRFKAESHQTTELNPPSPPPEETLAPPPQGGIPLPVHYYESAELDVRAKPVAIEPLIYPEGAYLRRIPGQVKIRIFINEAGGIDGADILASDPPGQFEQAALDALLRTRFKPAEILGLPVKSVKIVVIDFDPFSDHP